MGGKHQPKTVTPVLNEVIEAAETMDTTRVRKEALAAIEDLKRKGPGSKRDMSTWGQIGQGALGARLHRRGDHRTCRARAALRARRGGVFGGVELLERAAVRFGSGRFGVLAGGLGFEPQFSESESDVLPLNYPPPPTGVV